MSGVVRWRELKAIACDQSRPDNKRRRAQGLQRCRKSAANAQQSKLVLRASILPYPQYFGDGTIESPLALEGDG